MQILRFHLGEEKHVRLLVHSTNQEPFTIRSASYELKYIGKVEASGECIISDHLIDAKIAPQKRCTYQLDIIYCVADETMVEQIEVRVT